MVTLEGDDTVFYPVQESHGRRTKTLGKERTHNRKSPFEPSTELIPLSYEDLEVFKYNGPLSFTLQRSKSHLHYHPTSNKIQTVWGYSPGDYYRTKPRRVESSLSLIEKDNLAILILQ